MPPHRSQELTIPQEPADSFDYVNSQGWTDGLPVIPPSKELVESMLATTSRDPEEVITWIPPTYGAATVEKVAINAVMAGSRPEHFPIILSALDALSDPDFYQSPIGTLTVTPLVIVNGPIRDQVGLNYGYSCLGGGTRANATIGRALRLIQINIGQRGNFNVRDQTTIGTPGKIGMCLAENEEASPWEPMHVERGFAENSSTVTVFNAVSVVNIVDSWGRSPESVSLTIGGSMSISGVNNYLEPAEPLLVLGVEHASIFAAAGLSKRQVKEMLWENAYLTLDNLSPEHQLFIERGQRKVIEGRIHITDDPDSLTIVVAGGYGPHSAFVSTFGRHPSITQSIEVS